jgi:hypothetical protein
MKITNLKKLNVNNSCDNGTCTNNSIIHIEYSSTRNGIDLCKSCVNQLIEKLERELK